MITKNTPKLRFNTFILFIFLSFSSFSQNVFISEVHVDNGVEVTGLTNTWVEGYSISVNSFFFFFGIQLSEITAAIKLTGNLTEGTNGTLSVKNLEVDNLNWNAGWFDWGRVVLLKNKNNEVIDAVYYGTALNSPPNNATYIGNNLPNPTSGNSIQLLPIDGDWSNGDWIEKPATKGVVNFAKSLSIVKNNIEGFKMYPNPVSNGQLNVTSNNWADKHVEIYNIAGQQVYSKKVSNKEVIHISNLNKGIYMVRINEEGKISTRKLVVN
ncbi:MULTISPECIES: T9SS type A sorting domain-containing protein [Flavobacteriaceae]|uniref:T9SS type A sorting domain-containing protein n=2 Tax=Flavobacteriaceae TaxID=49546 RepID=A0A4Y8AS30_9FLAO|nr:MULTISPECIES: T9SS type A sorting domain-containing protein [Flavobacteriaceae]TEW73974.1 T9SS type A sorting domain-containing protein [Gramella jeungdoensis]GGK39228.1 hypothetical protein GCM10007963_04120 [Lutibacter litoralis]